MKIRKAIVSLAAIGALLLAAYPAMPSQAASINATFTTRIYYQNPNNAVANAVINFYPEGSATADPVNVPLSNIPAFASGEVWLGSVGLNGGGSFKGSAVISADQNVVAASSQVSADTTVAQLMSTAFSGSDAATTLYLATFLYNLGGSFSTFSVQNTEADTVNFTASFFVPASVSPVAVSTGSIPANSVKTFSALISTTIGSQFINYINGAGAGVFNGSAVVTATLASNGSPAHLVGVSEERFSQVSNNRGYAYPAISQSAGATTVYIPTALCQFGAATTFLAVQNMGTSTVDYTVKYYDTTGANVYTQTIATVNAGGKKGFNPCQASGNVSLNGSAVLTGASIATVIGKAQDTNNYTTAYIGQGTGSSKLTFPFVRWGVNNGELQSFLAIQNVGASIPAGQIVLKYYNADGTVFRTCTSVAATAQIAKVASNLGQTGATTMACDSYGAPATSWAGSAIITGPGGSQMIAISRSRALNNPKITGDINALFLP